MTDPQTAQERTSRDRRISGAGVTGADAADREANYQAYLRLLNNAQAQGASGTVHDHFNAIGITVVSGSGRQFRVGGDDTLRSESDAAGATAAATAASLSRQAIDEILQAGQTGITTEQIFSYVPTMVVVPGVGAVPLAQWQDSYLRELCFTKLFPEYYRTLTSALIGAFGSEMVDSGISADAR